jgi:hypothetical protein
MSTVTQSTSVTALFSTLVTTGPLRRGQMDRELERAVTPGTLSPLTVPRKLRSFSQIKHYPGTTGAPGTLRPLPACPQGLLWLACVVFTGAKMRLDVGFNAAQARLANLAHSLLYRFP